MKTHAIIPIFIPHKGCPNSCVFCNQNKITANDEPIRPEEITSVIDVYLNTLKNRGIHTVEAAFYGGSFTGIPLSQQSEYLEIAYSYKRRGMLDRIRLSTRPDYIDETILSNLRRYGVDTIELGVQSFDETVLERSNRGHSAAAVYESSRMITDYGFELGLQLMVGLPGDTPEKDIYSANELVRLKPSLARIYPTVVLAETELSGMLLAGEYKPLSLREAVDTTKKMYKIISAAEINIIRVGLKARDISPDSCSAPQGGFHPALRQLVESEIAREILEPQLAALPPRSSVKLLSSRKSFSNLIGHRKSNKLYFSEKYPLLKILYETDAGLADNRYVVIK